MSEPAAATLYAVVSGDRLKLLMERTGTGDAVTSRELAEAAGVAHGTIGALMSGAAVVMRPPAVPGRASGRRAPSV